MFWFKNSMGNFLRSIFIITQCEHLGIKVEINLVRGQLQNIVMQRTIMHFVHVMSSTITKRNGSNGVWSKTLLFLQHPANHFFLFFKFFKLVFCLITRHMQYHSISYEIRSKARSRAISNYLFTILMELQTS